MVARALLQHVSYFNTLLFLEHPFYLQYINYLRSLGLVLLMEYSQKLQLHPLS